MELNKEQALRLWNAQLGKKSRATDYAGRQMDKAAYNCRNSRFGWNVDHIYPQSKGGKTADYNLICCNIQTNDEKADRFPCFRANGKAFEIQRRQNHYEIIPKSRKAVCSKDNFCDGGQIIDFWEHEQEQQEYNYVGYAKVRLTAQDRVDSSFIAKFTDFLKKLYHTSAVFMVKSGWPGIVNTDYTFTVINFDMPLKEDTQNLLDECIILNTVGQYYLHPKYGCEVRIYCGMTLYESNSGLSAEKLMHDIINRNCASINTSPKYYLAIHGLVWSNTNAREKIKESDYQRNSYLSPIDDREGFFPYDETFPQMKKILEKQF